MTWTKNYSLTDGTHSEKERKKERKKEREREREREKK